jgi:uncharacterized cupredoxin-like copper-binding protein
MVRPRSAAAAVGLLILLAACSPSASSTDTGGASVPPASEGAAGGGTTVGITLEDGVLTPDTDSAPAGEVTFDVSNEGTVTHEFVIIRTDLAPDELPVDSDGAVDESSADIEVVDEIEDIEPGATASVTADLDAGSYVLICNVVDSDFGSHFAAGMSTAFTVE